MVKKRIIGLGLLLIGAASCSGAGDAGDQSTLGSTNQEIRNGYGVLFPQSDAIVNLWGRDFHVFGSGTLLSPEWILTSGHYFNPRELPQDIEVRWGNRDDTTAQVRRAAAVYVHPNYTEWGTSDENFPNNVDVALVRVSPPFTGAVVRSISSAATSSLLNTWVTCSGYGNNVESPASGLGSLRWAQFFVSNVSTNWARVEETFDPIMGSQIFLGGDSGGPCYDSLTGAVVGVISSTDSTAPSNYGYFAPSASYRSWVSTIMSSCTTKTPGAADFCDSTCPCTYGAADCDNDSQCASGMACDTDVGAGFGLDPTYDVCVKSACTTGTLGADSYCSATCPCGQGGGDCDNESQCLGGLTCANDFGPAFNMKPVTDVCVPAGCETGVVGSTTFCSATCPCGHGGGDCDNNSNCMPGMVCATDFGAAFKMTPVTDVCVRSGCETGIVGSSTFCTATCPCGYGGGDCDSDADCAPSMVCATDYGPAFNMSTATDVCVASACANRTLYATDFCSPSCPCGHGGGDCDSDADCMPGLVCGTNNGAQFGQPADWDICVRP